MFTDKFVELLQSREVKAYRVAKETNISQGQMGYYFRGERIPTAENLVKIADFFDVSVDYLLGRTDNPEINR